MKINQNPPPEMESTSIDEAMAGISSETYAAKAKKRTKRGLLCMLRDARNKLAHHGQRSFMGKEAKKEIVAAEAELRSRGIDIPAEGNETVQWEKKKK